jgi:hypothetical protein
MHRRLVSASPRIAMANKDRQCDDAGASSSRATASAEGQVSLQSPHAPGRRGVRIDANRSVQWKTRTSAIPIDSAYPAPDLCDSGYRFSLDPPTTVWSYGTQEARRVQADRGFVLTNEGIRKRVGHCHDSLATYCIADDYGPRVEAHAPRKNARTVAGDWTPRHLQKRCRQVAPGERRLTRPVKLVS